MSFCSVVVSYIAEEQAVSIGKYNLVRSGEEPVRSGADPVRSTNFDNHSIYEGYFSLLSVVSVNKVSYPSYAFDIFPLF